MLYSQKELSQLIVESCVAYNVEHIIISPGSRNAPLTIGFTNHPNIKHIVLLMKGVPHFSHWVLLSKRECQ